MANNEYINKVEYGDLTLMDITDTTAESGDVIEGQVFYAKSGARSVGTLGDATTSTHGLMSAADKSKLDGITSGAAVTDVLINNTSILSNGIANIPSATTSQLGLVKPDGASISVISGLTGAAAALNGKISILCANDTQIKEGNNTLIPIPTYRLHMSVFYGLAKVAGVDLANETVTLGTYPDTAKAAIQLMLGVPSVSDLSTKANISDIPVEYGTGIGSIKLKNFTISSTNYTNTVSGNGSLALGGNNSISDQFSVALGLLNTITTSYALACGDLNNISGIHGITFGSRNTISASTGIAFGYGHTVSGQFGVAMGDTNIANCTNMVALGKYNVAANTTLPTWTGNTVYLKGDIVSASYMGMVTINFMCKQTHTSPNNTYITDDSEWSDYWGISPSNGDSAFVIGNGSTANARSNAVKYDFAGNGYFGGDLFVNCDSDSTGGVKLATIEDVESLEVEVIRL